MRLQLIRKDGRIRGLAFLLGDARVLIGAEPQDKDKYWRMCDTCLTQYAIVFCKTHARYSCGRCLADFPGLHTGCFFVSMSVARDLVTQALARQPAQGVRS